jgi:protein-disulfide isomerase
VSARSSARPRSRRRSPPEVEPQRRRGLSPIAAITAIAGIGGLLLIAGAFLLQRPASTGAVDATGLVAPATPTLVALADGRSLGRADAPVTLEVWSDFQCPVCRRYAETVEPVLVRDLVANGTLRIVHRDAAFQGQRARLAYDESVEAGAGARCAAAQARYWPFHDWLFANQAGENRGAFADARLRAIAGSAGLDVGAWDACRASGEQQTAVRGETDKGVARGIDATPTLFIDGQQIVGLRTPAELGRLIQAAAATKS